MSNEDFDTALIEHTNMVREMRACLDDMEYVYKIGTPGERAIMLLALTEAREVQSHIEARNALLRKILAQKAAA